MKRIVFLMMVLMLTFGLSFCHAESWQQVDNSSWVDVDSIRQENDGIIKAVTREYLRDNNYYSMVLLIDVSNRKYCYEAVELYSIDGRYFGVASVDPKDKDSWINYKDDNKVMREIIERAAEK